MANNNNSNKIVVPEAKAAMEQFKMQAASEVGVNLQKGYNGNLTSREAGSVGGQMVKKICPELNTKYTRENRASYEREVEVGYIVSIVL